MLNYKSSIIEDKKYSGLSIKEISPIMKLNLRGKSRDFLSTIGKNINMILPIEANTSSSSDKYTSMWLSPDEWMIISNNIIDKENNILKTGIRGELALSGAQITKGYWQNKLKNEESFFNKKINGAFHRFYKTGDSCYFDSDGEIMFFGRLDNQVKIQGYRIELGELECILPILCQFCQFSEFHKEFQKFEIIVPT